MLRANFRANPIFRKAATENDQAFWQQLLSGGRTTTGFTLKAGPQAQFWSKSFSQAAGARRAATTRAQATKPWLFGRLLGGFSRGTTRAFRFSSKRASAEAGSAQQESLSLSQRLKKLSREYGWSAVGVYFALSVLDFPFCFLLVRIVGTDRIGELEHWVTSNVAKIIPESVKRFWRDYRAALKEAEKEQLGTDEISEHVERVGWGVAEAEEHNRGAEASLGTQLALAYAIHKSFIFLRVPLTAALTPKIVKVLRSWGWQLGKRKVKKP